MTTLWDEWGVQTPVTILGIEANAVIRTRWDPQTRSFLTQVGAIEQPKLHRLALPQLQHFRRWGAVPKRELTEFKVSEDAILPDGRWWWWSA